MKRATITIGVAATALALSACGAIRQPGPLTSQQRDVAGIHAVDLETSGDLTIRTGTTEGLVITAGANVLDSLTSEVVDGILVLDARSNLSNTGPISYTLTVTSLDSVEVEGSGDVTGSGVLTGDGRLTMSGSGSATLSDLELTSLSVDLSGSGNAVLSGRSGSSAVGVSGSGDYDGSQLTTNRTTVDSSGSGQARVNVVEHLTVTVSGSGDVTYRGHPAQVDRDSSGSGDIVAG